MTLQAYINNEIKAGRFPQTSITSAAACNGFWLEDGDFNPIAFFASREAAEKARSKAIVKATRKFA